MKKICFGLVLMVLALNIAIPLRAQTNPKLLEDLDQLVIVLTKSLMQYELRQSQFNVHMPYTKIIPQRKAQIKELQELIVKLEGVPKEVMPEAAVVENVDSIINGMIVDAKQEISIVELSNKLLYAYDDPRLREFAAKLKDNSNLFYMLFNNESHFAMIPLMRVEVGDVKQFEKKAPKTTWTTEESSISGNAEF